MVKGDAYGHGATPVARALEAAGADGFCVAALDEALALREAGIERPILVLYPIPPELAAVARDARLAVTAGEPTLLRALLDRLERVPAGSPLDLQLEVETGLGRGGFSGEALLNAARTIESSKAARLVGVWTHLQAPEDEPRTRGQVGSLTQLVEALAAAGVAVGRRHASASGSLVLGDGDSLDGVRPGLVTYGIVPEEVLAGYGSAVAVARDLRSESSSLRPVLSLHARPVRVADLPTGWGISYGPSFTTSRPSRIATLPLGYGDGWSRALSNRASALVRGRRVPLVGNVAMDAIMADVTDVEGEPVGVHDEFVLIGAQGDERITATDVAVARGTNSWEVVTNLSARLPRVYHAASAPREIRTLVDDSVLDGAGGRRSSRP